MIMSSAPKISVIVPIYNVEKYLKKCLDSLASQTLKDIEVILVNDGSTDRSGEIMHQYAAKFSNFYAFDKTNGGLGQARNFGVTFAKGRYIAFVDSDDFVEPAAYEKMYSTAELTHSDLVIGNVIRFNAYKKFPSVLHQKVFRGTKLKTHVTRDHELIYDTTAWNKLFRTSFWKANHFSFPEKMLYEDIPITFPAHYLATTVDVLEDVVYAWRFRSFGDHSITQSRTDISNLRDRLKAIDMLNNFFEDQMITGELCEAKDYKLLSTDFLLYMNKLPAADSAYADYLLRYVTEYLREVPEKVLLRLQPIDRMKYYFVKEQDKEKLFRLINFQKTADFRRRRIIRRADGHYYDDLPFHDFVPKSFLQIENNLKVVQRTKKIFWDHSELVVKGFGFIEKIDVLRKKDVVMKFSLINETTGECIPITLTQLKKSRINTVRAAISGRIRKPHFDLVYHYDWSAFVVRIPFDRHPFEDLSSGTYTIRGEITAGGLSRSFTVTGKLGEKDLLQNIGKTDKTIRVKSGGSGKLYIVRE